MASSVKVAAIFLLCLLIVAQPFAAQAGITCGAIAKDLGPCIPYLQGKGLVATACCGGVRSLLSASSTTVDRQQASRCLNSAAGSVKGINLGASAALPRACHVSIPYAISPKMDYNKVR